MTTRLEIPSSTTDRLAEIFESYIPFNKFLGLRCLEIKDGSVRVDWPRCNGRGLVWRGRLARVESIRDTKKGRG